MGPAPDGGEARGGPDAAAGGAAGGGEGGAVKRVTIRYTSGQKDSWDIEDADAAAVVENLKRQLGDGVMVNIFPEGRVVWVNARHVECIAVLPTP